MISTNVRPSSIIKELAYLAPAAITGATSFAAFVDVSGYHKLLLVVVAATQVGCDVEMVQSTVLAGTNPAALNFEGGVAKYTIADGDDNKRFSYDVGPTDAENGVKYVNVKLTPAGSGTLGAYLYGVGPKYETGPSPSSVP